MKRIFGLLFSILLWISLTLTFSLAILYYMVDSDKIIELVKDNFLASSIPEEKVYAYSSPLAISLDEIEQAVGNNSIEKEKEKLDGLLENNGLTEKEIEEKKNIIQDKVEEVIENNDLNLDKETVSELLKEEKVQEVIKDCEKEVTSFVKGEKDLNLDKDKITSKVGEAIDIYEKKTGKNLDKEKIVNKVTEITKEAEQKLNEVKNSKEVMFLTYLFTHKEILIYFIILDFLLIGAIFLTNHLDLISFLFIALPIFLTGLSFSLVSFIINTLSIEDTIKTFLLELLHPFKFYGTILLVVASIIIILVLLVKAIKEVRENNKIKRI